jgi:hypothetical protein
MRHPGTNGQPSRWVGGSLPQRRNNRTALHPAKLLKMSIQRYVSEELTHFVGRALEDEEKRFDLLLKILRSGELRVTRNQDGSAKPPVQTTMGVGWFSERNVHQVAAVCFCDIPETDLPLHIKKYSRFGLAFSKTFLLSRGASPVFYIANDAMIEYRPQVDWASEMMPPGQYTREFFLNSLISAFYTKRLQLFALLVQQHQESTPPELRLDPKVTALITDIEVSMRGIDKEFLSYCVPFRASQLEDGLDNFYMEREWRTLADVQFELGDVCRVILPENFAKRLRSGIPDYCGQLSFSR